MVYNVVCAGVTECSNTLEDEEDKELLPQAIVYKPCRQRIYGLLLLGQDGTKTNEDNLTLKREIYLKALMIDIYKLQMQKKCSSLTML